jgi:hypothetical protein
MSHQVPCRVRRLRYREAYECDLLVTARRLSTTTMLRRPRCQGAGRRPIPTMSRRSSRSGARRTGGRETPTRAESRARRVQAVEWGALLGLSTPVPATPFELSGESDESPT